MAFHQSMIAVLLIFLSTIAADNVAGFSRKEFPSNFVFGVASSAYQYEGAYNQDGKGLSNWDIYSHTPGNIADGKNGDIAADEYNRYKEDVEIMSEMGVEVYRFSIAWSRIFPEGRGEINPKGARYYNDLINELLSKEACFRMFGDRMKYWATFNEPNLFITMGYEIGGYPPQRCSPSLGDCSGGNSSTEPYIAGHNLLSAHASAVDVYRREYQGDQGGLIGIVISVEWYEPFRNCSEDLEAVERILAFHNNWYLDPIVFGEYPAIMRKLLGIRLPTITEELCHKLRGSIDFIGLNYYSSFYATDTSYFVNSSLRFNRDIHRDSLTHRTDEKNGIPIGHQMYPPPMTSVPYGIEKIVNYIKTRYLSPLLFISENGFGSKMNDNLPILQMLNDTFRADCIENVLKYLAKSIREGADVRGYFVWTLMDNFEWVYGYTSKFGLYYIDFMDGLQRYPKLSAYWYRNFLHGKSGGHIEEFISEFTKKHANNVHTAIAKV